MSTNDSNGGKSDGSIDHTDEETLRRLYWDEGYSTVEISDMAGVYPSTINNQMEKNGIERRDKVEASIEKRRREYANYRVSPGGYPKWEAKYNGKGERVPVHRLLAVSEYGFESVCGNSVHHINNISWDNRPENIEVMDHAEHTKHHHRGEDNKQSKLREGEVREIKRLLENSDMSQNEIAERFNTTQTNISAINVGKAWTHVEIE